MNPKQRELKKEKERKKEKKMRKTTIITPSFTHFLFP